MTSENFTILCADGANTLGKRFNCWSGKPWPLTRVGSLIALLLSSLAALHEWFQSRMLFSALRLHDSSHSGVKSAQWKMIQNHVVLTHGNVPAAAQPNQ